MSGREEVLRTHLFLWRRAERQRSDGTEQLVEAKAGALCTCKCKDE